MVCISNCVLALVMGTSFVISMISGMSIKNKLNLDPQQLETYNEIVQMRLNIFFIALASSVLISGIVISQLNTDKKNKLCIFVVLSIIIINVVYIAIPKKKWIIKDIDLTPEQRETWIEIYKEMRLKKLVGLIVGCILYFKFSTSLF
tara:strand:- start:165 stop:605 length:441 start_codon:yes stop_codon:yes gene_type:complete